MGREERTVALEEIFVGYSIVCVSLTARMRHQVLLEYVNMERIIIEKILELIFNSFFIGIDLK